MEIIRIKKQLNNKYKQKLVKHKTKKYVMMNIMFHFMIKIMNIDMIVMM